MSTAYHAMPAVRPGAAGVDVRASSAPAPGARLRVGLLATHPVQYYCPWYRELAKQVDLDVFFSHRQTSDGQAAAGYGVKFEWDVPLLEGYRSTFLRNVARRPDVSRFWGCNTPDLPGIIRERRFDGFIVHGWSTFSYWQAMRACWRTGTPIFVRGDSTLTMPRAWWWRALKEPIFRWFLGRFDGYLVVGRQAREYYLHYGADPERCFDAPHSVDNRFFSERASVLRGERARLRREFGLPEDAVVFLFVGRFVDRKRPELFVRALSEAARVTPGIAGLMVGDGPLRSQAEDAARTGTVPVRFAGFLNQTEMVRAYAASDVLVVPSTWETWGLVANEAMAAGLTAIVTDTVACAGDLVSAGETGEVVPVDGERALVESMARLAGDPAYRSRLSEAARRRVERFDVSVAAAGTTQAVHETAKAKRERVR